jgi:transmembrane sensor
MFEPVSSDDLKTQAARWAARLDRGPLTGADAAALEDWLAGTPNAKGALLKAEAAMALLGRARALRSVIPAPAAVSFWTRRRLLLLGTGGALAASLGAVATLLSHAESYATEIGEVRRIPLSDGSVVALNTESAVRVDITPDLRQIQLTRGEAWFQVAKDRKRPFLVAAGHVRVRAVGTAFSVRRREAGTEVLVTEGTVETWALGEEAHPTRVSGGERVVLADHKLPVPVQASANTIARSLAWRDGQIALEGETLADAAAEFNRYNRRKVIIEDEDLGQEKLVGQFRITEPAAFAESVVSTLDAEVREDGDSIRLSRRLHK